MDRAILWLLLTTSLLLAGPGAAESIEQEVLGHEAHVYIWEAESHHHRTDTDELTFIYHRESRSSGATVDGEGGDLTLMNESRELTYDDGSTQTYRDEDRLRLLLRGQAAGVTTEHEVSVERIDRSFYLSEDEQGEARHWLVDLRSDTYGHDLRAYHQLDGDAGVGDLVLPEMGHVRFVNGGLVTSTTLEADETLVRLDATGYHDTFAGQWTGSFINLAVSELHCQGTTCQGNGVSEQRCLLGYQFPFFIDCWFSGRSAP
ncbi:MAG: hypothetical protein R3185_00380 [Candidatus Thermoplasmatota archaeon]|nr:hypothetical protein [Candidatus Thermoplasmatota archaeon]